MSESRSGEWGIEDTASVNLRGDGLPQRPVAYLEFVIGSRTGEMMALAQGAFVFGSDPNADLQLADSAVSDRHALLRCEEDGVFVEDLGSKFGTFVNGDRVDKKRLSDRDEVGFGTRVVMRFMHAASVDESKEQQLYDSGVCDEVTGLHNQHYLLDRLEDEISWSRRHKAPLVLITMALDGSEELSAIHGIPMLDHILVTVGRTLRASLRTEDLLARLSRGPFAVACRGIRPQIGVQVANRLRAQVAAAPLAGIDGQIAITLSAGIAGLPDARVSTGALLLRVALDALDEARKQGDRSVLAPAGER